MVPPARTILEEIRACRSASRLCIEEATVDWIVLGEEEKRGSVHLRKDFLDDLLGIPRFTVVKHVARHHLQ